MPTCAKLGRPDGGVHLIARRGGPRKGGRKLGGVAAGAARNRAQQLFDDDRDPHRRQAGRPAGAGW